MLDDLKVIHERDQEDTLGIAERQYKQLTHEFEVFQDQLDVDNIVFAGMGGSALVAVIATSWPTFDKPFEVLRNYDIPAYVNDRTYFIASSYSGNTEETLSALAQAEAKGAQIAVLAAGGKLMEIAQEKNYPLAVIPKAEQPRYAVFYFLKALVSLLSQTGLLTVSDAEQQLAEAADFLKQEVAKWVATVPQDKNPAKQIALDVIGNTPVIYAGPKLWPAAYKWKISFNENAKHVAWAGQYPEFNHNEFMGWTEQPVQKPYTVIDLRSNLEHQRIQKRFEVSERLLSGKRPAPIVVNVEGANLLQQLLWAITFGDFVTIYTALLCNVDPAPVNLIEKFKKSLDE
jgi:glucose/mannose-6-phosphate isomerase